MHVELGQFINKKDVLTSRVVITFSFCPISTGIINMQNVFLLHALAAIVD